MLAYSGPYLIHCYAGIDRTGFVCAVLEALMEGAPSGFVGARAVIFEQLALANNGKMPVSENLTTVAETLGIEMTMLLKTKLYGTIAL